MGPLVNNLTQGSIKRIPLPITGSRTSRVKVEPPTSLESVRRISISVSLSCLIHAKQFILVVNSTRDKPQESPLVPTRLRAHGSAVNQTVTIFWLASWGWPGGEEAHGVPLGQAISLSPHIYLSIYLSFSLMGILGIRFYRDFAATATPPPGLSDSSNRFLQCSCGDIYDP